jgi:hypothetical protein
MTERVDAITAMLYVLDNSAPFTGSHALYSKVKFVRFQPLVDMETPTVALEGLSGINDAQGLGTVDQYRQPDIRCHVLTDTRMDAERIWEKCRAAFQYDFNCEDAGAAGTVGNGYLREVGYIKYLMFNELTEAPWDRGVFRFLSDVGIVIGD